MGKGWERESLEKGELGGAKNREKKIKHTVTTCLKKHRGIGTKVCLGATLRCMYVRTYVLLQQGVPVCLCTVPGCAY